MKFTHMLVIMFIGSFMIQYFLMSPIMVDRNIDITNSYGKAYLSVIMALFMVLFEVLMKDFQYKVFSLYWYIGIIISLASFVYLYRKQIAIDDKQYLEEMIEHHSMALLTSKRILEKTDDYDVIALAKRIVSQQEDEIQKMSGIIMKIDSNKKREKV